MDLEPVALYRRDHRRDGRPDDGRRQGDRGRRSSGSPRWRAPRASMSMHGDAAPVGRRHHRHDQGQLPDPHLLPGHLQDRQPHHPRRAWAPSSCSARATCSTWPAAGASPASTAPSSPMTRSRRSSPTSRRKAAPQYLDAVTSEEEEPDARGRGRRRSSTRAAWASRRATTSTTRRCAVVLRDKKCLDLLHPAPPADRLQPRRLDHGADGERGHRRPRQPRRQTRNPRRNRPGPGTRRLAAVQPPACAGAEPVVGAGRSHRNDRSAAMRPTGSSTHRRCRRGPAR